MATQVTLNSGAVASAGSLKLQTNGTTDAVTIDTAQNMGLGVTPSAWYSSYKALQIKTSALAAWGNNEVYLMSNAYGDSSSTYKYLATGSKATSYVQYEGTHLWNTAGTGTAGNPITFTQAMTLDASGNLIVGGTSALNSVSNRGNISIRGSAGAILNFGSASAELGYLFHDGTNLDIRCTTNGYMSFDTNNIERARIDSSGNLLVGQTTQNVQANGISLTAQVEAANTAKLNIAGAATTNSNYGMSIYSTGASAFRFYVGYGGTIYATSTTITGISDRRFKENIRDLDDGLASILALQPRKFDWKEGKGADTKNARGFIAQEFETVFPDLIDEWQDAAPEGEEPYKAVRADLIPVLVKAIQELKADLDAQRVELNATKAELAALKG